MVTAILLAPLRSYHLLSILGFNLSFFRLFFLITVFVFFLDWFRSRHRISSIKRIGFLSVTSLTLLVAIFLNFPSLDIYGNDALSRTMGRAFGFVFVLFFLFVFSKRSSLQAFIKAFILSSVLPLIMGGYQIIYFFRNGNFPLLPFSEFAVVSELGAKGLGTLYWRYPRLASTFLEPNYFGMYLSVIILITLSYYLIGDNRSPLLPKWVLLCISGAAFIELIFTLSLSSFIGLFSGILVLILLIRPKLKKLLLFFTLLVIFIVAFNYVSSRNWNVNIFQIMKDRVTLRVESYEATEELDRLPYFMGSVRAFGDSPLIGVGYETLGKYTPGVVPSAHNSFLTFLAAHGVLGFVPLILFFGYIFYLLFISSISAIRRDEKERALLHVSLLSSLFALVISNQLYDAMFSFDASWVLIGLSAACAALTVEVTRMVTIYALIPGD